MKYKLIKMKSKLKNTSMNNEDSFEVPPDFIFTTVLAIAAVAEFLQKMERLYLLFLDQLTLYLDLFYFLSFHH